MIDLENNLTINFSINRQHKYLLVYYIHTITCVSYTGGGGGGGGGGGCLKNIVEKYAWEGGLKSFGGPLS